MKISKLIMFVVAATLTACGKNSRAPEAARVAQVSMKAVGCKVSQSEMWNGLQSLAEDGAAFPTADEVRAAIRTAGATRRLSGPAFDAYVEAFANNYAVTIEGIRQQLTPGDTEDWKTALAQMEAGVRPTDIHAELDAKIEASLAALNTAEQALHATCEIVEDAPGDEELDQFGYAKPKDDGTVWYKLKTTQNPEVYGSRRVLATAYQSCDVVDAAPMTTATPNVSGIKVVGRHPAGGLRRQISNVATVAASDYYIKNRTQPKSSCFEVRNNPLIYDFGGKPFTTAASPKLLDIFKNAGSGQKVLGIDCSAYVFSSLMAAGLKTDPAREMKGSLVLAYGSAAFKEPQRNSMRCLAKIGFSKTESIVPGDIIAINGHVVMIDQVGADPFGLRRATKVADCTAAKINSNGFDFVIAQSSPSKAGIGINRFDASDYFATSLTFKTGVTKYAVAACRAQFGAAPKLSSPALSIVRHKHTSECRMPALKLAREECVDSCRAQ